MDKSLSRLLAAWPRARAARLRALWREISQRERLYPLDEPGRAVDAGKQRLMFVRARFWGPGTRMVGRIALPNAIFADQQSGTLSLDDQTDPGPLADAVYSLICLDSSASRIKSSATNPGFYYQTFCGARAN
jgi:hypothetical protein